MKFFATVAALAVAAVASAQAPEFKNCATNPVLTIKQFDIAPYPLCIGKKVCATGEGTLAEEVQQGSKLAILGKFMGRVVYSDNHDLCDLMSKQDPPLPCPIPTTITSLTSCVDVKSTAPAGIAVELTVQATMHDGRPLFCQKAVGVTAKNC